METDRQEKGWRQTDRREDGDRKTGERMETDSQIKHSDRHTEITPKAPS